MVTHNGLTLEECEVVNRLSDALNAFMLLPKDHLNDLTEFRADIHSLQDAVLARSDRRLLNKG